MPQPTAEEIEKFIRFSFPDFTSVRAEFLMAESDDPDGPPDEWEVSYREPDNRKTVLQHVFQARRGLVPLDRVEKTLSDKFPGQNFYALRRT